MDSANPLPWQVQGPDTTEMKRPLAGVVVWWWWCAAATAAAAAVACDVGTHTHKTGLCPGGARRTSFVKIYVDLDCSTRHGPRRHSDRDPGSEKRNNLYILQRDCTTTSLAGRRLRSAASIV